MTTISISLSSVTGLDWQRWQRLATEVEALGFAGLYCRVAVNHVPPIL